MHPRRFARNATYERFLRAHNDPGTRKIVVVVAVVHHNSWAAVRAGPSKHMGRLMDTVDVVVVVAVEHHISWAAGRAGHQNTLPPHGPGGAVNTEPTSHGVRPGLANQICRGWAAARPGPSKSQRTGHGPT